MKTKYEGDLAVFCLEGCLDMKNAESTEAEIRAELNRHPGQPFCLDAEGLTGITSTGLRTLLKLRQEIEYPLTVRNVSPEMYQVFEVTGFTALLDVRRKRREIRVDGCEIIGRGAFGTVYCLDGETVVKVYGGGADMLPMIEEEQAKARQAFLQGLPTAIPFDIVKVGDHYGAVFEMINARSCGALAAENPAALEEIIPRYAALLKEIHAREAAPGQLESARDRYLGYLDQAAALLPEETVERVKKLLLALPGNRHLIHGDIHLKNVMMSGGEMTLIDMDKICTGDPVFEFAGLYTTYILFSEDDPGDSERFFGISRENAARIVLETLAEYLNHPGEEALRAAESKIRLAAELRFLDILLVEQAGVHSPLKDRRIRRAAEELECLAARVDGLAL